MTLAAPWPVVPLEQVAVTALGKMLDVSRPKGALETPYLRNINVQWGRIDTTDVATVALSEEERARFAVHPGDLLVCEGGAIGRAAIWHGPAEIGYQKALHRVRSRGDLDLRWLRYLLEQYDNQGVLAARATGSTIKHLPQVQLRQLPVPLPELSEQQRIVDTLEDHLSRLDAADSALSSSGVRSERLSASWMSQQAAISDAPRIPLGDLLAAPLRHGRSVPTAHEGFPVLRLTALRTPTADLSERKIGAWSADEAASFLVQPDDFLVARGSGSRHLVGRGARVEPPVTPVAFPDTAIRVRVLPDLLTTHFLSLIWNGPGVRRQIEAAARTTAGIHKVNQGDLRRIVLPVPPLEAQRQVSADATTLTDQTLELNAALRRARVRATNLRRSLLASAFSGRL
jgi:type I restriction enzyme S subunit